MKNLKTVLPDLLKRVEELHEFNPMLGHRGCRLGMTYPEITEMQARAIFEAAVQVAKKGVKVIPEVMIPLIGGVKELENQKKIVVEVADEVLAKAGMKDLHYLVGTMIEIPRAAITADSVATRSRVLQLRHQRSDADDAGHFARRLRQFRKDYEDARSWPSDPFAVLDQEGVGKLIKMAVERAARRAPIWKWASAANTAASPVRCSSATAWAWITFRARLIACRSPGWRLRRRRSRGIGRNCSGRRKRSLVFQGRGFAPAFFRFGQTSLIGEAEASRFTMSSTGTAHLR